MALEASKLGLEESHNSDIARLKSDRDIAQSVANELRLQNEKLNLIISKEATKFPSSTFIASSCHTNPLYEKDPPNGDKRLDELLSAQKQHGDKTGLGFISKTKKKRNKKKNNKKKKFLVPTPPSKKRIPNDICFDEDGNVFEKEGELVKEVVGNAKRAMPNHNNFVGKYNPSYVLFVLMIGTYMPNLLDHPMNALHGLFGFLRPLSLTKDDPLKNGDLKPRLDLL
jgi:hypothetical protein